MDAATLVACFDASFSPHANIRIASELELRKLERVQGMPATVLQIISSPDNNPGVRLAAAVYLKNRIRRSWSGTEVTNDPSSSATSSYVVPISETDRHALKQNILPVLVAAQQSSVKVQLKTCIATMTSHDFPEKWPDLMEVVVRCIQSGQEAEVEAGLLTLIEILKIYRYRRYERDIPNQICEQTMPLLVNLGQRLLAASPPPAAPENLGRILHLISKAYKISIIADLSPHQASNESILQWGTFLLQIVCRVIPEESQPEDKDEREKWSWWKAKKWAHHVLNRLYNTYGCPSQLPSSRKGFQAFAQNFETHFAPEILKAYLKCVENYVNGHVWMSRRCSRFVLEFLEDCVKPKNMWQQMKPHLGFLIENFVFPSMCLTDEELEQFDDDPVEYSRAHFGDYIEDWFSSPITAAISFVQILTKSRKQATLMPMLNVVNSIVAGYPAQRTAKEKDGALRLLSCLADVIVKTKGVGDQMQEFFVNYVFPEFSSKVGHLRVRALDMVEKFEEVDMTWPDSNRLTEMFHMVMVCVTDEALPVRVQAALALPELVRYDEVRAGLAPNVGRLMQELLKLSEETDIDALSKPTRALVTNFPDELLPFATGISTQMRDSYLRLLNEIIEARSKNDPEALLAGDDDNGLFADESDEKILVAMNVLQTLETLLRSVSSAPPIVAEIEKILLPMLALTIQHDFVELFDDLFELIHSLTYFQRSISSDMWQLFEQLYSLAKGLGIDFMEEMVNVFDNFVSYGGSFLATSDKHKHMLLDLYETAMTSEQLGATDRVSSCKLAGQTMLCLRGCLDDHLERYIMPAMEIVTRKKYSQAPIVTVQSHANALELVVTALYYNPPLTLSILSKHGQTEAFFKQWFLKLGTFTRVHDRKICILAITALFSSLPDQLGSMPGVPGQLMQAALSCFDGLPKALENRKQMEDDFAASDADEEASGPDDDFEDDVDDEDDVYDEDNDYAEMLAKKQLNLDASLAEAGLTGSNGAAHEDEDEDELADSDFEDEGVFGPEQLFETPLDKVDSYIHFAHAIHSLEQTHQNVLQQATGSLTPEQQQTLHTVVAKAQSGGEGLKQQQQQQQQQP